MKKWLLALICLFPIVTIFTIWQCVVQSGVITKISQESSQKETLSNLYICEVLGVSRDKMTLLEDFNIKIFEQKLTDSPVIKNATISIIPGGQIKVSYDPYAIDYILSDFINRGCSNEGKIFPIEPFFPPKKKVKVFLGISELKNKEDLTKYSEYSRFVFAQTFMDKIKEMDFFQKVECLDVSKVEEISLGKNQIVLIVNHDDRKDYLRLTKRNYLNELKNYTILYKQLENKSGKCVLDFRYEKFAFMKNYDKVKENK